MLSGLHYRTRVRNSARIRFRKKINLLAGVVLVTVVAAMCLVEFWQEKRGQSVSDSKFAQTWWVSCARGYVVGSWPKHGIASFPRDNKVHGAPRHPKNHKFKANSSSVRKRELTDRCDVIAENLKHRNYTERILLQVVRGFATLLPTECIVVRDGAQLKIMPTHVVRGDVVVVKSGDKVPADLRLIVCFKVVTFKFRKPPM